ncbi:radical SAM protein [Oryzomonas rubra]|uniref:Radical SAM protein n=1 Tax=Oryzomonas rubra TaxID=2509454 RepID=A0A5A9XIU8_9BACT|nr:radical SAM protein [Oryzomonas rubra]KAA0892228.1 radical SAM protein [Oryzomonas rubra]
MTWKIRQKLRALLEAETCLRPDMRSRGGQLTVCLVYPNSYQTAMSSLGFQTVFGLLAESADILCERAFLPDREDLEEYRRSGTPLLSLESQRPLADFDAIAFSTSFEPDYLHIPLMLELARIPVPAAERTGGDPLVIAGGAAFFINPEPVADFLDVVCIGEGEELIPALVSCLMSPQQGGRGGLLSALAARPGFYVPSLYLPRYDTDGRLTGFDSAPGAPLPVVRACPVLEQHQPAASLILTDNTEFGDMFLVEVSRGCPRGCRFCSAGFIYGPFRQQPFEHLTAAVDEGLRHRSKVGLVGAAVSDYRDIGRLCSYIVEKGAKVSVSSLRIDRLDSAMLDALTQSGHKTISLAPEGGSQRLRDLIRKNLNERQILDACDMLISRDILNLKLYFIIGLPTETEADLDELLRLVAAIRERVLERARANKRIGEIILSVNPFIPKPFTPFQWCGMEPLASLERKVKLLETAVRAMPNVRLKVESLRESYLQALLSRGDRRLSGLVAAMAAGSSLKKAAKQCGIDTEGYVCREIPEDAILPWSVIGTADREQLRKEYERAMGGVERKS